MCVCVCVKLATGAEGFIFKSYHTDVLGRMQFLSLDYPFYP